MELHACTHVHAHVRIHIYTYAVVVYMWSYMYSRVMHAVCIVSVEEEANVYHDAPLHVSGL